MVGIMTLVQQLVEALEGSNRRLFHFTDSRNIPSIAQHGLLSTAQCIQLGLPMVTGGDTDSLGIDRYRGFDQFVRLSFCRSHPMSHVARERGTIEQLRILTISPSVLLREGVRMSDRVATDNDAQIGVPNDMISNMDLEATYQRIDWKIPENQQRRSAAEKWEAMIPGPVGTELIAGL